MDKIVLQVENVQIGYSQPVLRQLSFAVRAGEMVGILGPNGAGKSTLLKAVRGLLPLQSGQVLLQGRSASHLSAGDFAREAAYLQQQAELVFGYTAREIVMAGRYPYLKWWQQEGTYDEAVVRACMEYTGVWELADRTMQSVSGGQRQRVLLAKVLAQQTPLLFLDEPAAGLDLFYQEEIFRFCRELCAVGKTVLMVVHELSLAARFCTRLLLLGQGRIIADGPVEEVLCEASLQEAYGVPVQVVQNPMTCHFEVFTLPPARDLRQQALLHTILGQEAGMGIGKAGQS